MRFCLRLAAVALLISYGNSSGQQGSAGEHQDRASERRLEALSRKLQGVYAIADPDQRVKARDAITAQIRAEMDTYVQVALNPQEPSERVQSRIRKVFKQRPHPEYGDLPLAIVADLRAGPALLLAYTIVAPPHDDLATVRGYQAHVEKYELVATTGGDFEGYSMFKTVLPTPVPGEVCLLAWGQAHTFNGSKFRFRVYSFDGARFETTWAPDDMFNAKVATTASGFTIDHVVRPGGVEMHDEYTLTANGLIKTASIPIQ